MDTYKVVGIMSGTSLDGLDIALCELKKQGGTWHYHIIKAETIEYSLQKKEEFNSLLYASAEQLAFADMGFGYYIGEKVKAFLAQNNLKADFIASHGHTVFHQPTKGFTYQIGSGAAIAAVSGLPVVSDFRSVDIALGGQGAPLVPIGDKLLFADFEFCLNLGGIANISFDEADKRLASDICPVNIVLNALAKQLGQEYDKDGLLARKGTVNTELLTKLNGLDYYKQPFPKSIGKEWIDKEVFPIINSFTISTEDKLATFCTNIAEQLSSITNRKSGRLLATGGGALNGFLIEKIKQSCATIEVVVPDNNIVLFKEALIFAFLGILRIRNEVNCLSSVTGASSDSIGGALYGDFRNLL